MYPKPLSSLLAICYYHWAVAAFHPHYMLGLRIVESFVHWSVGTRLSGACCSWGLGPDVLRLPIWDLGPRFHPPQMSPRRVLDSEPQHPFSHRPQTPTRSPDARGRSQPSGVLQASPTAACTLHLDLAVLRSSVVGSDSSDQDLKFGVQGTGIHFNITYCEHTKALAPVSPAKAHNYLPFVEPTQELRDQRPKAACSLSTSPTDSNGPTG